MDNSIQLDNIALTKYFLSPNHLKSTQKLVLLGIFRHRNNQTFLCFPTLETIAANTGLNQRTVRRTIEELETGNDLIRIKSLHGKRVAATYYFATFDFRDALRIAQNEDSVFYRADGYELLEEAKSIYDTIYDDTVPF